MSGISEADRRVMGSIDDPGHADTHTLGSSVLYHDSHYTFPSLPIGKKEDYIFNSALLRPHSFDLSHTFQALSLSNTYEYARGLSARTLSASARTTFSSLKRTQESPPSL